ncbi:MAG: carboxypeptidase-like regulatory domain-containing protein [Thermofilum sp.]
MRLKLLAALLVALVAALLALSQQYSVSVTAAVIPVAQWTVTVPPTVYPDASVIPVAVWSVMVMPSFTLSSALAPVAVLTVTPLPVFTLPSVLAPSYTIVLSMFVRLPRWDGSFVTFDASGPVKLGRRFWASGVRVEPVLGEVSLSFDREVLTIGACSSSGSTVRLWGSCLVGEPVYATFSVVDPQGIMKLGVAIQVNGTQVEPNVLYTYPGASNLVISLVGARVGRVYVNGSLVGVGLDSFVLSLENATTFLVRVVARGQLAITVRSVEVVWSSGGYARLKVAGVVKDADYGAPVPGARVKLYSDGVYYDNAVTRDDGTFLIDTLVRATKQRLPITLTASHDDYETATVSASATLPKGGAGPAGLLSATVMLAGLALAAATVAALAALARVKKTARRR